MANDPKDQAKGSSKEVVGKVTQLLADLKHKLAKLLGKAKSTSGS